MVLDQKSSQRNSEFYYFIPFIDIKILGRNKWQIAYENFN